MFPTISPLRLLAAALPFILLSFWPAESDGQILRRLLPQRQSVICDGPLCQPVQSQSVLVNRTAPPLVVETTITPDELSEFEQVDELNAQWVSTAAQMRVGGSCGSGSLVGILDGDMLFLTNAHVVGTRPGTSVTVSMTVNGQRRNLEGSIVMAAYSSNVLADWAIVRVRGDVGITPRLLSIERPRGQNVTVGSPRCVWPLVYSALTTVQASETSALWRWRPNSIPGQSGSAVWNVDDGLQYGLITWSWSGLGAGQQTWWIYQQATRRSVEVGELRPAGLIELTPRHPDVCVEEGFFVETSIGDLPIWSRPGDVTPPPDPVEPCPELEEPERRLIDRLRALRPNRSEKDWVQIIMLIIQLIELLSKRG